MDKLLEFKKDEIVLKSICSSDKHLGYLVNLVGDYRLDMRMEYFPALVRSIVGQMLSIKVAQSIWQRVLSLCPGMKPEVILSVDDELFRSTGLSKSKTLYIKDLAFKVSSGKLDLDSLNLLSDEEVIKALATVKGIGKWTAEMFLIFSLGRPDVLSLNDIGLKRAVKWLYNLDEIPDNAAMTDLGDKWKPYRTAASLYLYEVINRGYIDNTPPSIEA
jgi:3-methyladenine DNA glycosylase/8-oxoguanine DNA glycosylase